MTPSPNPNLPISRTTRAVFAGFAILTSLSYGAAALNLYLNREMADGEPGLTRRDIELTFHGEKGKSRMLSQLTAGSMQEYLPPGDDGKALLAWLSQSAPRTWKDGAEDKSYDAAMAPMIKLNCTPCHHRGADRAKGENPGAPLESYEDVSKYTGPSDSAMPWKSLAWVSHIHLFAIGFAFLVYALITERLRVAERIRFGLWILSAGGLLIDVGGWWLTRLDAAFAPMVQLGGGMVAASFGLWGLLTLVASLRGARSV